MTTGAKRAVWLRAGLWPAVFVALLPATIALLHLAPRAPALERPAMHHGAEHQPAQSPHRHHATDAHETAALVPAAASEDRHTAATPQDDSPGDNPSHHARPHCPLCLWLQGFHVLPAPDAIVLRRPHEQAVALFHDEARLRLVLFRAAAQPRAPPAPLPV